MTILPDFKTIHNESECETRTDLLALRLAVRLGRPIALGCVVAIPDSNWAIRETRETQETPDLIAV